MKCIPLAMIGLLITVLSCNAAGLEPQHRDSIKELITLFKKNDRMMISERIVYPLLRQIPIPAIKNKEELIQHYETIFDVELTERIANSTIEDDWAAVGLRGIMLDNGLIWLNFEGKIIAVNFQSDAEARLKKKLIETQKHALHASLRTFEKPVLAWKTARFRIRIDDMGEGNYRYASWSIDKAPSEQPDLVLFDGVLAFDGSGGNHRITFSKGAYQYICYVTILSEDGSPSGLVVLRNGEELLHEPVLEDISESR